MDAQPIVNKVAKSDLVVFDLESLWDGGEVVELDLAPFLFKGLMLREKDFREAVNSIDTEAFADKHIAVFCSTKAIIPTWAYMLVTSRLSPKARSVGYGSKADLVHEQIMKRLAELDWDKYQDRTVIVKGCPSEVVPTSAYVDVVASLQRVAAKIMYGEACSSVPIWRRPSEQRASGKAVAARLPKTS
jgi:hypothetical protein